MSRAIEKIKNRIYLLIGRAILKAVNNTSSIQKLKVEVLKNEKASDIDRIQEYGLETYPKAGTAEVVILFPNGNRNNGVCIKVGDKTYRPSGMSEGDVCLYNFAGTQVWLKNDNTITITAGALNMLGATEAFVKGTTHKSSLDNLCTAIAAIVPAGSSAANITSIKAAFAAFSASLSSMLSTTIKGE